MGLLGKIFGRGKPGPVAVQIELGQACQFLEKEVSGKRELVLSESGKRLAEIRHLLKETGHSLQLLERAKVEPREGSQQKQGRLDKIVQTAKSNALTQLSSLLEKLSPPKTGDLAAIREYCAESVLALQQAGSFGKNVAYAGISFKSEVKAVGQNIKQLNQAFLGLQQLLDKNKPVFVQPALEKNLAELNALQKSIAVLEKEVSVLQKGLEGFALEKSGLLSGLRKIREGDEFKSIASFNERKASLLREKQQAKTELLDLFAKVEKPLHRLDKAAAAKKIFLPESQAGFLHQFLLNPFRALKRDPKAQTLKAVLAEARNAVDSGLIELKEREREKKLALLQELLAFDFFSEIFWKFNRLDSELLAIERRLGEMPAIKEEARLLGLLQKAKSGEDQARQQLASKNSERESNAESVKRGLDSLQRMLSDATGKSVAIMA